MQIQRDRLFTPQEGVNRRLFSPTAEDRKRLFSPLSGGRGVKILDAGNEKSVMSENIPAIISLKKIGNLR